MERPVNLDPELHEIWEEMAEQVAPRAPDLAIEALCRQVALMRDAAGRIQKEGAIVVDGKGNAVQHPAIAIEREAGKQVREWLAKYGARRRS